MQVIPSMTKSECMYALHWIDRLCVRSKNKECVILVQMCRTRYSPFSTLARDHTLSSTMEPQKHASSR